MYDGDYANKGRFIGEILGQLSLALAKVDAVLYPALTKQVIHRDPNPGNMILTEGSWGFIDFEMSEKNVRIFDPCYVATAILSETFEAGNEEKLRKWLTIFKNILCGYDAVENLLRKRRRRFPM